MKQLYPDLSNTLKRLLFQRNIRSADLARAVNLPLPTIHRLVTGKSQRPFKSSLTPIAEYFNVSTEQLLGLQPLPVNQKNNFSTEIAISSTIATDFQIVSLQSWDSLSDKETKPIGQLAVGNVSKYAFALVMQDHSMQPLFEKDCILIFDPKLTPSDYSFVLIKRTTTNSYVFRQLIIDQDKNYIKALNPDISASSIRTIDDNDEIIGCLVETRSNFYHHFKKDKKEIHE